MTTPTPAIISAMLRIVAPRMRMTALLAAFCGLTAASCAIGHDDSSKQRGYILCDDNDDCEEGVCFEGDGFKYCGIECAINDDCRVGANSSPTAVCTDKWRCKDPSAVDGDVDAAAEPEAESAVETESSNED